MSEEWKPIAGYDDLYQVSSLGRIKSLGRTIPSRRGNIVKPEKLLAQAESRGYRRVVLVNRAGKKKTMSVHRLVALAFISVDIDRLFVNHIDGNKTNNRVDNLEWCTQSENQLHAVKTGLQVALNNNHPFRKRVEVSRGGVSLGIYNGVRELCRQTGYRKRQVQRCLNEGAMYGDVEIKHVPE